MSAIPCAQLARPALVARLASTMDTSGMAHPSYALRPGFCRFCNHPLPYQFSVTGVVEGVVKRMEWSEGDPVEDKIEVNEAGALELGNGTALVHRKDKKNVSRYVGLHRCGDNVPDLLLAPNGACAVLTNDVFAAASRVAREKATKLREAQQVRASAHQLAAQKAARIAARSMAETQAADATGSF